MAGSVSRTKLLLELTGKGVCECELVRHLAPFTVGTLLTRLPLEGRSFRFEDKFVYFETGLAIGTEKQRSHFRKGDMTFMIASGSVCTFLQDTSVNTAMNPIGKLLTNIELCTNCVPGDVLQLRIP